MKKKSLGLKSMFLLILSIALISCAKEKKSNISEIHLNLLQPSSHPIKQHSPLTPTFNCYAIFMAWDGNEDSVCYDSSNSVQAVASIAGGFLGAAGGSVNLEVDKGDNRRVQVIGFQSSDPTCPTSLTPLTSAQMEVLGMGTVLYSGLHSIVDNEQYISVSLNTSSTLRVSNCIGSVVSWDGANLNSSTVTYYGNNNTGGSAPSTTSYNYGDQVTVSSSGSLVKTGSTFAHWNTAANDSGTSFAPSDTFNIGTSDVNLFAIWTSDSHTLSYNGNGNTGGTVPASSTSYSFGSTITVLGNTGGLTKTNYTFDHWNTAPDNTGSSFSATNTFSMGGSNITLYAIWVSSTSYTVTPGGANVSITPSTPQSVASGSTTSFIVTAITGTLNNATGGTCTGSWSGSTFTAGPITANCTITFSSSTASSNLLPNAGAESGNLDGWSFTNGGDGWAIFPHDNDSPFQYPHQGSNVFVTSFSWCLKSTTIDLAASGFTNAYMDTQPAISASEWYASFDSGISANDSYQAIITLYASNGTTIIDSYDTGVLTATYRDPWAQMSHTFSGYGPGVRYIKFDSQGRDGEGWASTYGAMIDDASLTVASTLYVSSTGDDVTGKGTQNTPFATLEKALSLVGKAQINILIAKGNYEVSEEMLHNHNVKLLGGYESKNWTRDVRANKTTLRIWGSLLTGQLKARLNEFDGIKIQKN